MTRRRSVAIGRDSQYIEVHGQPQRGSLSLSVISPGTAMFSRQFRFRFRFSSVFSSLFSL